MKYDILSFCLLIFLPILNRKIIVNHCYLFNVCPLSLPSQLPLKWTINCKKLKSRNLYFFLFPLVNK